jgi:hypothetical protein
MRQTSTATYKAQYPVAAAAASSCGCEELSDANGSLFAQSHSGNRKLRSVSVTHSPTADSADAGRKTPYCGNAAVGGEEQMTH